MIQDAYNTVLRPHLPRKLGVYQDITARGPRLLDTTDHLPEYKQGLFRAIRHHVPDGAAVELVGFGRGVSTVHLLRRGASHVTAHDAAAEMLDVGRETLALNDVPMDAVTLRQTLIGEAIDVYGDASTATQRPPGEFTDADVLVLDCEGAEAGILNGLGSWPDTVIVETHPEKGVPAARVETAIPDTHSAKSYRYEPDRDPEKVVLAATTVDATLDDQGKAASGAQTPARADGGQDE